MTISAPQQTLLYTPKFSFTLPSCGTVPSYASCFLYASTSRTDMDKNAFSMAYQGNWITTRAKMDIRQKCPRCTPQHLEIWLGADAFQGFRKSVAGPPCGSSHVKISVRNTPRPPRQKGSRKRRDCAKHHRQTSFGYPTLQSANPRSCLYCGPRAESALRTNRSQSPARLRARHSEPRRPSK